MQKNKKTPCDLALDHFDFHYGPVYDHLWPSIRAAMLSKPKHCALVNNFASDRKEIGTSLAELGAHDFIWTAREKFVCIQSKGVRHGDTHVGVKEEVSLLHCF